MGLNSPSLAVGPSFFAQNETFSPAPCTVGHDGEKSIGPRTVTLTSTHAAEATPSAGLNVLDLEERSWLARHCRGDQAAFPALMEAYRRPVYSYLVRGGVAEADRDDLFQSIFLKIHKGAAGYEPARPLAPWIFTIVANTLRNHFRDRPVDGANLETPLDLADPTPGPERVTEARQAVARLEVAIAALPLAQREVLLLTAVAELKQQEVADALGLPLGTVKTQLRRARLALAKTLAPLQGETTNKDENHDDL